MTTTALTAAAAYQTVTVPGGVFEVLTGPVSFEAAYAARNEAGDFSAVVAVPTRALVTPDAPSYDEFYNTLLERLVVDAHGYLMDYKVLAVSADAATLFVAATTNIELEVADRDEYSYLTDIDGHGCKDCERNVELGDDDLCGDCADTFA